MLPCSSGVEALGPVLHRPPLSEVQVDVGGDEIVNLVSLLKRKHKDEDVKNQTLTT